MDDRPNSEFVFSDDFKVTPDVQNAFDVNGYVLLRGLLSKEEVGRLKGALESPDGVMNQEKHFLEDGQGDGRKVRFAQWRHPGNDITGLITRCEKTVSLVEQLLGGEVYHYHGKVISKEPKVGGQHVWHQDYGYWYQFGCVFPDMGTMWTAVDKTNKENGCVQLLAGSHLVGRLDHVKVGDQAGADLERVKQVQKYCPLVYAEVEPGDAFFFHSNVLHRSADNFSDKRRWGFLVAYNRKSNNPVYKHHHPFYTPIQRVPNSAILACQNDTDMTGKEFSARDPKRISPYLPRDDD